MDAGDTHLSVARPPIGLDYTRQFLAQFLNASNLNVIRLDESVTPYAHHLLAKVATQRMGKCLKSDRAAWFRRSRS